MKGKSLPPIPIHQADVRRRGCFDSAAFEAQTPGRTVLTNPYEQISKLSERADVLKQENEILRQELYDIVMTTQDNQFVKYKKNLLAFSAKMTQREKELTDVCNYLSIAKKSTQPAFVEISQIQNKQYSFDTVATSLLVANQQRSFFSSDEIAVQNEQIRSLITKMSEDLKQLNARIAIYEHNYQDNVVQFKINSLRKRKNPLDLVDTSPGKIAEQNIKIKLLQKELRHLVNCRVKAQKEMYSMSHKVTTPKQPQGSRSAPRPNPATILQNLTEKTPKEESIEEMVFSVDKEEAPHHPVVEPPPRENTSNQIQMPEAPSIEIQTTNQSESKSEPEEEENNLTEQRVLETNDDEIPRDEFSAEEISKTSEDLIDKIENDQKEEIITSEQVDEVDSKNIKEEEDQKEITNIEEIQEHAEVPEFRQPPKNETFTEFWRNT